VSNRLSDAIYMTKRVVARHPNVDLAAPYPRKLAFDGGEHMVIVKLGVQTGRHVALDRLYIMLKPTLFNRSETHPKGFAETPAGSWRSG
jgi:hypothetical protein